MEGDKEEEKEHLQERKQSTTKRWKKRRGEGGVGGAEAVIGGKHWRVVEGSLKEED